MLQMIQVLFVMHLAGDQQLRPDAEEEISHSCSLHLLVLQLSTSEIQKANINLILLNQWDKPKIKPVTTNNSTMGINQQYF